MFGVIDHTWNEFGELKNILSQLGNKVVFPKTKKGERSFLLLKRKFYSEDLTNQISQLYETGFLLKSLDVFPLTPKETFILRQKEGKVKW